MKLAIAIAFAAAAVGASAQETKTIDDRIVIKKMLSEAEMIGATGGFMGKPVKGAPYSGEEVHENTQVLADGTHIHNEVRTTVYRDSEGRVRRETGDSVTIWDPVANASYFLNTKNQTYGQMPLAVQFLSATASKDGVFAVRTGGAMAGPMPTIVPAPPPLPLSGGGTFVYTMKATHAGGPEPPAESIGHQIMEGVSADGTRRVETIEAGTIGNDRPIQITTERWYSPDLQTVMMTRHNDPRTGEEVFRLTGVNRTEPPTNLFTVPPGYQKLEGK